MEVVFIAETLKLQHVLSMFMNFMPLSLNPAELDAQCALMNCFYFRYSPSKKQQ